MKLLLPLLAAAAASQPIAFPTFPVSRDFTAVARWLEREAGVPRRDLVVVQDDLAWTRTPVIGEPAPGQPIAMRVETLDAAAWRRLGGRSAVVFLDADCTRRRVTLRSADIYAASNLLGDARRSVDPAALSATPDVLNALALGLCRGPAAGPLTVATAPPSPPPPRQPLPQPTPALQASPPRPVPAPPAAAQAAPRAPAPPAAAKPATPAPVATPPRAVPPMPAPPAAAALPDPAAARTPEPSLAPTVQIGTFGATGTALTAYGELAKLQPRLLAGKLQRLEPVTAPGGVLYRAVLTGFSGLPEAEAFCRTLTAAGKPCVVRPAP